MRARWGIRARRFEKRIKNMDGDRWVKKCWEEKEKRNWKDQYGKEKVRYYNRNGWGIEAIEINDREDRKLEKELLLKEKDIQRQMDENKIRGARYNIRYKDILSEDSGLKYLRKEHRRKEMKGIEIRVLVRTRCGNMEECNKYWLNEESRLCILCGKGWDNWVHYVKECEIARDWFSELGEDEESRLDRIWSKDLDRKKGFALRKLWMEKKKVLNRRRKREKRPEQRE